MPLKRDLRSGAFTNLLQFPVSEWIPLWQLSQNGLRIFCKVIESGGESFFAYLAQQLEQTSTTLHTAK
jgi:hypothetical protein